MHLKSIRVVSDTKIELLYQNGEKRLFDASPYMEGSYMGELKNPNYFRRAKIHPLLKDTICWPHEQDIAPHELYEFSQTE